MGRINTRFNDGTTSRDVKSLLDNFSVGYS